jgi:Ca2+-binding EF-hand superfamily protein
LRRFEKQLPWNQKKEIEEVFRLYDTNGSGMLSGSEIESALCSLGVAGNSEVARIVRSLVGMVRRGRSARPSAGGTGAAASSQEGVVGGTGGDSVGGSGEAPVAEPSAAGISVGEASHAEEPAGEVTLEEFKVLMVEALVPPTPDQEGRDLAELFCFFDQTEKGCVSVAELAKRFAEMGVLMLPEEVLESVASSRAMEKREGGVAALVSEGMDVDEFVVWMRWLEDSLQEVV